MNQLQYELLRKTSHKRKFSFLFNFKISSRFFKINTNLIGLVLCSNSQSLYICARAISSDLTDYHSNSNLLVRPLKNYFVGVILMTGIQRNCASFFADCILYIQPEDVKVGAEDTAVVEKLLS